MSLVKAIRDYMRTCPEIKTNAIVNIDNIANGISFSITFLPTSPDIQEFINGDKLKQKQFVVTAKYLTTDGQSYIDNQELLENFEAWFEQQEADDNFPFVGANQEARSIYVSSAGYLSDQNEGGDKADYQMTCVFTYKQKGA